MSGEEENAGADPSNFSASQRACQACRSRKIKCDKLDPCSSCQGSNIPCRRVQLPQPKRQRVLISPKYEEQLEMINARLAQMQLSINNLSIENTQLKAQNLIQHTRSYPSPRTSTASNTESGDTPYLGNSSFEIHSEEAGKILDETLRGSPSSKSRQGTPSILKSLRTSQNERINQFASKYSSGLPMIPVELALALLTVIDVLPHGFLLCAPIMGEGRFKECCQRIYFPANGYTMSDFIVANGGLLGILQSATDDQLRKCDIDPACVPEAAAMCETNVMQTLEKLSYLQDPTMGSVEGLLFGAQIAIIKSDTHLAWRLISTASRLCLDSGFNKLPATSEDTLLNTKKSWFWFAYLLDKAFALALGRTPNFSDYDITTPYPNLPSKPSYDLVIVWFDAAKVQGQIYEQLYSARGSSQDEETKTRAARLLASDLIDLRDRCHEAYRKMTEAEKEPFLDTEMTILSDLALVYRSLPSGKPAHPLRVSEECISIAREGLALHQTLCLKFLRQDNHAIRAYVDWSLAFSPFTPFIVVLGTTILTNNLDDLNLLGQVVDNLLETCHRAPGAKKIYEICRVLYKGAQSCIEQNLRNMQPPVDMSTLSNPIFASQEFPITSPLDADTGWQPLAHEDWSSLQLDNTDSMMSLFDNYLAGNPNRMPIYGYGGDVARYDMP